MGGRPTDEEIVAGIAEALPVGVWVARAPGGEFVYANSTFAEIMGMAARDDVGLGEYAEPYAIHDREGNLYAEDRMPFVRALTEQRTVMLDDLVIRRTDGRSVNVRAYARPIFRGGEISHVVIAFFDITREVEGESRLRRAQRMEAVGNLAGGIAHDFNNLLTVVQAIASSLALEEDDPQRRSDFDAIEGATQSAVHLTRALLGFAGRGKNLAAPVSLQELIHSLSGIFERAIDARITVRQELGTHRWIEADHSQLEQVVMNLVLNARDAIDGAGEITLRLRDQGPDVVLEVDDTGPGVPHAIRDRIFDPYFTTKQRGDQRSTGLGLATVYGIVESHRGDVQVLDAPGGGARFRVRLPAIAGEAAVRSPQRARRAPIVPGEGLVMVVDDEPAVRHGAERALEAIGYRVISARDGEEALERFAEHVGEVRAVLLDLCMPGLDGQAAFRRLRETDPDVKVLLMTGYALNEEAQQMLDDGVAGFLAKPFDVGGLSSAIAELLA